MTRNGSLMESFGSRNLILPILSLSALAFSLSLFNGFVWDDWPLLVYNSAYHKLDLRQIFLAKGNGLEYLPIRDLTLQLDALIWGIKPFGFHLTNLIIYVGGVFIVFKSIKNMHSLLTGKDDGGFMAFWGALIFALHPLHAEPVDFITGRNTLLAGLFLFSSLNLLIIGMKEKKDMHVFFSVLFFILSLFSKASAVFYSPFLLVLFLLMPKGTLTVKKSVVILLIFFAVDIAALFVHFRIAQETAVMNYDRLSFGTEKAFIVGARALQIPFFYLKMLVLPYPLSVAYPVTFMEGWVMVWALLAAVLVIGIVTVSWVFRKKSPIVFIGVTWFLLSLGPVLNIFPTQPTVADRYAYFAVFGFGIVMAYLLNISLRKSRLFLYIAWIIVTIWCGINIVRTMDWRNDITLWESALRANPDMSRYLLADALWSNGRYEEALTHLREENDRKGSFRYYQFMGRYLARNGNYGDAIASYKKSLLAGGDAWKDVYAELGDAYEKSGAYDLALQEYLKAIETKTGTPLQIVDTFAKERLESLRERYTVQINELKKTALNEPANFLAQANLALFLHNLGMYDQAETFYLKAIRINPSSWEAWYNLGLLSMKLQRDEDAVKAFERSLSVNPANVDALNNIGISWMKIKKYASAEKAFKDALIRAPHYVYAAFNLGRMYFIIGDAKSSKEYFLLTWKLAAGDRDMEARINTYLMQMK